MTFLNDLKEIIEELLKSYNQICFDVRKDSYNDKLYVRILTKFKFKFLRELSSVAEDIVKYTIFSE